MAGTPRRNFIKFSEQQIKRPQKGLIAIAYNTEAQRDGSTGYVAYCKTAIRRLERGYWRVAQHQRTPPLATV